MLININTCTTSYNVRVTESLDEFGSRLRELTAGKKVVVITNGHIASLYADRLKQTLSKAEFNSLFIEIKDGEQFKSIAVAEELYEKMFKKRVERFTPLIALGGGVIGDIAGFVASTYLRGLPFYNIPTSLIAQVDSSIGGKTAVNLKGGKNLVGTFYQPLYVHTDAELLKTLEKSEFQSGLAEVIKHSIIKGEKFFKYIEDNIENILNLDTDVLEIIISECVKIKGDIISEDEKELGLRRVLNLGHTLGHALETTLGYGNIKHGEGIAIGIYANCLLAEKLGRGSPEMTERIKKLLKLCGLPVSIDCAVKADELIEAMYGDKKVRGANIEFVLPSALGDVAVGVIVEENLIREVIRKIGSRQ